MTNSLCRCGVFAAVLLVIAPRPGAAQIPDKFTNLKILPADSTRQQVVQVMRGFAGALGVRCNHCHVGENAATLEGFDFADDSKEAKRVARTMMEMTREINTKLLPASGRTDLVQVQCVTCHRGLTKPQPLVEVLKQTVEKKDVSGAIAHYKELREKYYSRGSYDFSAGSLNGLAEWLATARKDPDGAIAVQQFNVEVNPNIATSYSLLGDLFLRKGDNIAARAAFERAAQLEPNEPYFKKRLAEIK